MLTRADEWSVKVSLAEPAGRCVLERQDGSPDRWFHAEADIEDAVRVFVGFLQGDRTVAEASSISRAR